VNERVERIRASLEQSLHPTQLQIEDESHRHAGHEGARDGRGHFRVPIVVADFTGMPLIKRHQRVYAALGDLMRTDIHALALETRAPEER
jgi:BolA protein